MTNTLKGGCLCGAVRYEITGELLMAGNCHCRDCQRYSGCGHVSMLAFPESAIQVTGAVSAYECKADSGGTVTRRFCTQCGSHVLNGSTSMPGMKMVSAGTLDDPSVFTPQMSVYTSRSHHWDPPYGQAPAFDAMPPAPGA